MGALFLVLEILIVLFFVFIGVFRKTFISKKTILFTIPILITAVSIYSVGYFYQYHSYDLLSFVECLKAGLKTFTLDLKKEFVQNLSNADILFKFDVFGINILGGLSLVSSILGLFKVAIWNFFKNSYRLLKGADIVVGYTKDAVDYCTYNKNSVLYIDSSRKKFLSEDKNNLFYKNISFISRPFTSKLVSRLFIKSKIVNVICFDDGNEYLDRIFVILDKLSLNKNKSYNFYIETNSFNRAFIEEQISKNKSIIGRVSCFMFDKYELISREFSMDHNIAKYLPREFLDDKTLAILPHKRICVNFIGFGKTAFSIFRSIILNNQFVKLDNNKYKAFKIDFNLFDMNEESMKNNLLSYIKDYESDLANSSVNGPELTFSIKKTPINVKSDFKNILNIKTDPNNFNIFVICLNNNFDNASVASQISNKFKSPYNVVFYNIDERSKVLSNIDNAIPFGFKSAVLKHSVIIEQDLQDLAEKTNENYSKLKETASSPIVNLPYIERLSNLYANMNLKFKFNLMGLDIGNTEKKSIINESEFFTKYYDKEIEYKNDYFFKINKRTTMAYQEHLRWCMFYLLNGFTTLKFNDIKIINNNLITKDLLNKKHACLINYYELDKLHKYELSLLKKNNISKTYSEIETYKYDFQQIDKIYKNLVEKNIKIFKL